jgi:hypothetical protein
MQRAYIRLFANKVQSDLRPRKVLISRENRTRLRLIQIYVKIRYNALKKINME